MNRKILILIIALILFLSLIQPALAVSIKSVSSSSTEIQPGEIIKVELTIENNLNSDVEGVVISLDLNKVPFAPYQSSNQKTLDEIEEDREEDVEFKLIADSNAKSGTYKFPVTIKYTLDNEPGNSSGVISLIINAQPKIKAEVEDSVLIKGQTKELTIKVTNSGLGDAKFLTIKLGIVKGIKLLSSDSIYIGDVDSDDFDTANFKVSVDKEAPSTLSLPVEITYLDSRNKEFTEKENLVLRAYTKKQAISLGLIKKSRTLIYVISIVILIVLFIVYRKIKKRRKLKREKESR